MFQDQGMDAGYGDPMGYTDPSVFGGQSSDPSGYQPTVPDTISGMELASNDSLWSGSFYNRFQGCMKDMGVPAPDSAFSSFTTAVATIKAIQAAVSAYGTEVTIAELIGAGVLADYLAVAGALAASAYAGICVGCLASAGIDMSGLL